MMKAFKHNLGWFSNKFIKGIGIVALLTITISLLDFLLKWGILTAFWNFIYSPLKYIFYEFLNGFQKAPVVLLFTWIIIAILVYFLIKVWRRLNVVAGVFKDDFSKGLGNWEFGGEGWKTEYEDGQTVLSVSESQDGGITKRGFAWSDYEFSFETKVISRASGWIIRAENRTKYFMLQLNMVDQKNPRLRPHFRYNDPKVPWIVLETNSVDLNNLDLKSKISLNKWLKVKIIVRGTEIDAFIDGQHVFHYFLPDPCRFEKQTKILNEYGKEQVSDRLIIVESFPVGRVGFRCAPQDEHAHFRNVKVKPILD